MISLLKNATVSQTLRALLKKISHACVRIRFGWDNLIEDFAAAGKDTNGKTTERRRIGGRVVARERDAIN